MSYSFISYTSLSYLDQGKNTTKSLLHPTQFLSGFREWLVEGQKKKKKNLQKAVKNLIMGFMWNIPIENLRLVGTRDSKNVLCSIEMTWLLRAIV